MFSSCTSAALFGLDSNLIQVEVDVSNGLPMFNMVGLLSTEVREAAERVKTALRNTGIELPPKRITVNFSPADIRKSGVGIDLPVAVGILFSIGEIRVGDIKDFVILGELGLNGEIKPVRGVLPIVKKARDEAYKYCIIPEANVSEGAVVSGIKVIGVKNLAETIAYLSAEEKERDNLISPALKNIVEMTERAEEEYELDFIDIAGQQLVKRAVEIAAAGFHNLLMIGPPGAGKSMIAKRIPTILPRLSEEESIELSAIYSVSGLLNKERPLITKRPFWSPHHSITETALTGGGRIPMPGVVSLSHRGVLFLDEMAEFSASTLDIMRQPLEDKCIRISRSSGTYTYPANYMLIGATNPCKCGYYPDRNKCKCSERDIKRYFSHISGPLLDRIDLCIEVSKVDIAQLSGSKKGNESSSRIRERVEKAHEIQRKRFKSSGLKFNADIEPSRLEEYCFLGEAEKILLEKIYRKMDLTARSYHKLIKVARTIADLDGSEKVCERHITEASAYRIYKRI